MVQYQSQTWTARSEQEYWKLQAYSEFDTILFLKHTLREVCYKCPKTESKEVLRHCLSREERGLMSYEGCNYLELLSFCFKRGLLADRNLRPSMADLKSKLSDADEDATFTRFPDLPAELRVRIYEIYVTSLPSVGVAAPPPPITQSSSLIRKEALSVFYESQQLHILVHLRCGYVIDDEDNFSIEYFDDIEEDTEYPFSEPADKQLLVRDKRTTKAFFEKAPMTVLDMIKRLSLTVRLEIGNRLDYMAHEDVSFRWNIELNRARSQAPWVLEFEEDSGEEFDEEEMGYACANAAKTASESMSQGIEHHLDEMTQRDGGAKLERQDLERLKEIARSALGQEYRGDRKGYEAEQSRVRIAAGV